MPIGRVERPSRIAETGAAAERHVAHNTDPNVHSGPNVKRHLAPSRDTHLHSRANAGCDTRDGS